MAARWILRLALLAGLPALAAVVQAVSMPVSLPPQREETVQAPGAQAADPAEAIAAEVEWARQHFEDGSALFVDARPLNQYEAGRIAGAFPIPFEEIARGAPAVLDLLPTDYLLIIYCSGGDCESSHYVQTMLGEYGYTETAIFEAGYPAWADAGLPVETGPSPY